MTVQLDTPAVSASQAAAPHGDEEFDLDLHIVEGGVAADQLIRLTGDNCNSTCATACVSCP
ncbi:FxLD family lanthipeptide [Streptomyces sp. NPDC017964]|uniref:FxLD family lanthipeptide n=1 Tax=Streptomyces sp. NPDC017964 TaxID=3365022 RepID=UPI0037AB97E8